MTGIDFLQIVQDAAMAALDANFNVLHSLIASERSVDPISLDFTNGSRNVCQAEPVDLEMSPLLDSDGASLAIWTGESRGTGRVHGVRFDGTVQLHVRGYLSPRTGSEQSNTQSDINAFLSATLTALQQYTWPPVPSVASFVFAREYACTKSVLSPLGNGYRQSFDLITNVRAVIN